MIKLSQKLNAEWILRISLGFMYIFSGIDLIRYPTAWYWAIRPLPLLFQNAINKFGIDQYLRIQGIGELALASVLLFGFMPRSLVALVAGLTVLEMATILVLVGVDAITFRDIGVLGAALALYVLVAKDRKMITIKTGESNLVQEEKKTQTLSVESSKPIVQTYDEFIKS